MKQESYVFFLNQVEQALCKTLEENPNLSDDRRAELEEMRREVAGTLREIRNLNGITSGGSQGGHRIAAGAW